VAENPKGNLFIGAGVVATGTMTATGLIEVDGTVSGVVTAKSINITNNGIVTGTSTADNIRVAGKMHETSVAHHSLLIESSGQVTGNINYGDLEIRKGGNLQGTIGAGNTKPAKRHAEAPLIQESQE
jgi:cytoskeletal protein CcmA (bactofilin family)